MVFSSLEFLFWFLPAFLLLYYIASDRYKNYVLLFASLFFYAYGEPLYLLLMVFSIVVNYGLSRVMINKGTGKASKLILVISLVIDFGILFVFKYFNFFVSNINNCFGYAFIPLLKLTLPLGISFYTFQISSYMVDIYRGKYDVEKNIIKFATYVSMFPQLIAGPIVSFDEVKNDLDNKKINLASIEKGLEIFIIGLVYKVLLANNISSLWNDVNTMGPYGINAGTAWLGSWGFSMQLYFDFFGYSLMAIGLGKAMGFNLPKNFSNPYMAVSLTDFWRRWHITLSRWFKNYVYIPLGGNRCSKIRHIFNLLIVWLLTGLWHGADWNFVLWGLCTCIVLILEKFFLHKFLDKSRILGHIYMLILIPVFWTIFNISDLNVLVLYLKRMFFIPLDGFVAANTMITFIHLIKRYWWLLLICIVCATPIPFKLFAKKHKSIICKIILFVLFWLCVYELVFGSNNPFLYFRF